MHNLLRKLWK